MRPLSISLMLLYVFSTITFAQEMPKEYSDVLTFLDRKGDYQDDVFRIVLPRSDLNVTISGIELPTSFGFTGWLAMRKGDQGKEVMMGDLVLLEDEVNPVLSAVLANGLEVSALHNHFFWEQPRLFFMHVHGFGSAMELAKSIKPALALMVAKAHPTMKPTKELSTTKPLNADKLNEIIGRHGTMIGSIYKVVIGRPDITVTDMGAVIDARMGLNTWAAIAGSDDKAVIAGDIAMLENEITAVEKALRANNLNVVALHHHMASPHPMIIFLHYWGTGPADKLAMGFRKAIDELGKSPDKMEMKH